MKTITEMQHEDITLTQGEYTVSEINGGWAIKCPKCGRVVASGMANTKKPKWIFCNGKELRKLTTNK